MPNSIQRPWAILLSRFQDDANDPTRVTLSALYAQWVAKYGAAMVSTWIDPGAAQDSRTILQLYQQFFTPVGAGTFNSVSFWDTMSHGSIDVSGTRVFPCRLDITSAGALAMGLSGYQYQEAMFKKAKAALAQQHSVNWKAFYAVAVSFQSPDYGDQGGVFDGGPGVFSEGYSQGWGIVDLNVHGSVRLGLSGDEVVELCALVHSAETGPGDKKWPPSLGLFDSVVVTLTYMRRNLSGSKSRPGLATWGRVRHGRGA